MHTESLTQFVSENGCTMTSITAKYYVPVTVLKMVILSVMTAGY